MTSLQVVANKRHKPLVKRVAEMPISIIDLLSMTSDIDLLINVTSTLPSLDLNPMINDTPLLHVLARKGKYDIVRMLVQHGADTKRLDSWSCTYMAYMR